MKTENKLLRSFPPKSYKTFQYDDHSDHKYDTLDMYLTSISLMIN